jgi:S-ribosylhomocysteine lyase LuxS involved in autoinducer biosynthesis
MPRQFKISNKHVCIFYLNKTHLHFTIVRSYQRSKVNESDITEVEIKKIKQNNIQKLTYKNITTLELL